MVPSATGSYALHLACAQQSVITVGRLGVVVVEAGWYVYMGSALGPGGLRGRLSHHLRPVSRPHWHIDYLRQVCAVTAVWYTVDERRWEHDWAAALAAVGSTPIHAGFGASDCRCVAHCFRLQGLLSMVEFDRQLRRLHPDHPELACAP